MCWDEGEVRHWYGRLETRKLTEIRMVSTVWMGSQRSLAFSYPNRSSPGSCKIEIHTCTDIKFDMVHHGPHNTGSMRAGDSQTNIIRQVEEEFTFPSFSMFGCQMSVRNLSTGGLRG